MKITLKKNTNAVDETLSNPEAILFHVCNNLGVMGSGIALEIKNRIPTAFDNYFTQCESEAIGKPTPLGLVSFSTELNVCNMIAQNMYRSVNSSETKFINYGALATCLSQAISIIKGVSVDKKVAVIPFKMGADRAGGDWNIVLEIVQFYFSSYFDELIICEI